MNDGLVFDLSSLKNGNTRSLIYDKLDVPHNLRCKYTLKVKDYIILDHDLEKLSDIFVKFSILLKDMAYFISN